MVIASDHFLGETRRNLRSRGEGETRVVFVAGDSRNLFLEMAFLQISPTVFWMYFAGAALSVTGAIAGRKEMFLTCGVDKLFSLARLFYAMPLAVFGAQHFMQAKVIEQLVPSWIPGRLFWTYFVGAALLAAALSIAVKKYGRLSGTLLGLMFFLFVVLMHIPAVVETPRDRIPWAIAMRDLSFSGGALAFAGMQTEEWRAKGTNALVTIGRIFITGPALFFGVEQLLHPGCVPGVALARTTPEWIPGHILWGYLGGIVSLAAGVGLMVNRTARMAATGLGIMVLVLMVFVYSPILAAYLTDITNGLDYFADTLLFSGAVLLLAGALPKGAERHV